MEQSRSIKCPSAAYHLTGTKKIQQVLALPGVVERFLQDPAEAKALRDHMTGLYPLDDSELAQDAVARCMKDPEEFVLKPQREGGGELVAVNRDPWGPSDRLQPAPNSYILGNNIYGKDIPPYLSKLSTEERQAYILMDRIRPPPANSTMVRNGELLQMPVVSELGVYGCWVSEGETTYVNEVGGHLLRTKASHSDEGGVAAGFAVLDSELPLESTTTPRSD